MAIDELDDFSTPPQKWLDKKQYVRIDPASGLPQLIRVEPIITDDGEFIPDSVTIYVDDETQIVMARETSETYLTNTGCVPLEITAQWKHRKIN